jgi:hypothetical protein
MTLAEKIGQMSQIERVNATADVMKNCFIGTTRSFVLCLLLFQYCSLATVMLQGTKALDNLEPINLVSVDHREH